MLYFPPFPSPCCPCFSGHWLDCPEGTSSIVRVQSAPCVIYTSHSFNFCVLLETWCCLYLEMFLMRPQVAFPLFKDARWNKQGLLNKRVSWSSASLLWSFPEILILQNKSFVVIGHSHPCMNGGLTQTNHLTIQAVGLRCPGDWGHCCSVP